MTDKYARNIFEVVKSPSAMIFGRTGNKAGWKPELGRAEFSVNRALSHCQHHFLFLHVV